jgi:hypothetical protein
MRSLLFSCLLVLCSSAAWAQAECVGIENDIARLACFDEAFADGAPSSQDVPDLLPVEAFMNFASLVRSFSEQSNGLPVVIDTEFDDATCRLAIGRSEAGNLSRSMRDITALVFDASRVAAFGQGYQGLNVQMQRGQDLMYLFHRETTGYWDSPSLAQDMANYMPWLLSDVDFGNNAAAEFLPSAAIEMITAESNVDQDQIMAALGTLIDACRAR